MPIHDWSTAPAGLFHHFHHGWTAELSKALNAGVLPRGYFALSEQSAAGIVPDVLTLETTQHDLADSSTGGVAVALAPPQASVVQRAEADLYSALANRVAIHHQLGQVVAVIEIVSPGNKQSVSAMRSFVEKAIGLLKQGIHLLIVDLYPPSRRDPHGIHALIWAEIEEDAFELPGDKQLTVVSYSAGRPITAYIEPLSVGDRLPDAPVFLTGERYVSAPLEQSYMACWEACPMEFRAAIERA